jgi:hypothetical protein
MTTPADSGPTDVEGRELPPYEGRRDSGDVAGEEKLRRDGANVGGATGPVESEEMKAPEPADTPRGAVASPADEQPAADDPDGDPGPASVGPSHHPGTARGEDAGEGDYDELGGES